MGDAVRTSGFSPDIHGKDCPTYCGVLHVWGWTMGSRPIRKEGDVSKLARRGRPTVGMPRLDCRS